MGDRDVIACVLYAAKSTEDRRGSIPGQLEECRALIASGSGRVVAGEYTDEAFSAFTRDRGPGLAEAMHHAEDLAAEHGTAELWVQHSDRLARGDGQRARHTVEIALWAIKRHVKIRTVQDPDTFRDLLYAVVTGQRNHEDSERKGLASRAGRKRAAARGDYIGHLPDGYRIAVDVDERGQVKKRMVFDPDRRPLIELIFRLALRGRNCCQITRTVNNAGWLTKPVKRRHPPRPFDVGKIYETLKNPRYAALATWEGEIVACGHWPAYITERQHQRIKKQLAAPQPTNGHRRLETYLLARLAFCGVCGQPFHTRTGRRRRDGSFSRTYICSSHSKHRGRAQCKAAPLDAHTAEAMVIASIASLLGATAPDPQTSLAEDRPAAVEAPAREAGAAVARERLRAAVLAGDEPQIEQAIEVLFATMQPEAALIRDGTVSRRLARELEEAQPLREWIEQETDGRTDATRAEAPQLNRLLRKWFTTITFRVQAGSVLLTATRRRPAVVPGDPVEVSIDRAAWTRFAPPGRRQMARNAAWEKAEIIGALQLWADRYGRSPTWADWARSGTNHPESRTLSHHFTSWNHALRKAGLPPVRHPGRSWDELDVIEALRAWARKHDRPPASMEWARAEPEHPSAATVRAHFRIWDAALRAAGLPPRPTLPRRRRVWSSAEILEALQHWASSHGRLPAGCDWLRAAPEHPSTCTVRNHFGSWDAAVKKAGLYAPSAR
jgi:DNA invertase Pin-like site-specific DNA recombinase